jgi:hypothetical protein
MCLMLICMCCRVIWKWGICFALSEFVRLKGKKTTICFVCLKNNKKKKCLEAIEGLEISWFQGSQLEV